MRWLATHPDVSVFALIFGTLILIGLLVLVKAALDAKFPGLDNFWKFLLGWAVIGGGLWFVAGTHLHTLRILGFVSAVAFPILIYVFHQSVLDGERKLKEQNDTFEWYLQKLFRHNERDILPAAVQ